MSEQLAATSVHQAPGQLRRLCRRARRRRRGGPYRQLLYPAPRGCPRSACYDRSRSDPELKLGTAAEHGWAQLCTRQAWPVPNLSSGIGMRVSAQFCPWVCPCMLVRPPALGAGARERGAHC